MKIREVVIVDDEKRIGQLISKLIHWEELSLHCMKVCTNGEEAFEIIREKHPDIVIADVRMPKISGLDLIDMTKKLYDDVKFIIISGHAEFEYAHRAMSFGVEDYLLKPVKEKELNEVLEKLTSRLKEKEAGTEERDALRQRVSYSDRIIRSDFLKMVLDPGEEPEEPGLSLVGDRYLGVDVKLDRTENCGISKKQEDLNIKKVRSIIDSVVSSFGVDPIICEKENMHIYILFSYGENEGKQIKDILNEMLNELQTYTLGFDQYIVTIGVGTPVTSFKFIRNTLREAYFSILMRLRLGTGRLIHYDQEWSSGTEADKILDPAYAKSFVGAVEDLNKDRIEDLACQEFAKAEKRPQGDFINYYLMAAEMAALFFGNLNSDTSLAETEYQKKQLLGRCDCCDTPDRIRKCLVGYFGEAVEQRIKDKEEETVKPIRDSIEYIQAHYNEKMTLEDVADKVGLNPVYLSVLFKKETGENFSSYLVNIRMEKAKTLLQETNDTIAAIGDTVGYSDSKYFSQLFVKVVGVKPALYRKFHSR